MAQKPLELILARNFLTSLSTPAFLVDERGAMVFYNEAAGAMLGISFEDSGRMPTTQALRQGRPAHGSFAVRSVTGDEYEIESTALPIVAEGGQEGAMIFFWARNSGDDD